ncbi:PadR family transcriptional regulator [Spirillospora sp. NPDC029432]|uniref:PadR family transcriptional regulator n=1 Tax=Spirillospora sp. NPDC029432 TaxID=3154599 RepID=UPI003454766D
MGTTHGHGSDLRWAFAAAALGAKAAHLAAHRAREHGGGCGPRAQAGGPQFGWMFGGGPGPWGPGGPPWGRGPWGRGPGGRGPRARKGNVRAAILALLAEEPRNGYQIIQEINERSGGGWKPSPGAVYPALQQLADEGLIRGEEGGGRRTFHLTDEGRAYVGEHADELSEPWAEMAPDFGEGVPDLFKQVAQTGAAVMQIVHSGSPQQVDKAKEVIAETRRRLYLILADDDPGPDAAGAAEE